MLHVLTAQIVAEERERAIQRRLREHAMRQEALAAKAAAAAPKVPAHDPRSHAPDRPCGACQSAAPVT